MELTGAEYIVECLKAEGVKHIFGVSGSPLLSIMDVLYRTPEIRYIQSQNEQGAAYMANGYARATRSTSVCLVSPGGGITNSVSGMAQAFATATPTLFMATEETSRLEGMGISLAHALDTQALMKPITKLAMRVEPVERIGESIRTGFRVTANGRKGPVYLGIPRDMLGKKTQPSLSPPQEYRPGGRVRGDAKDISKAAELLAAAQRPAVLADDAVYWDRAQGLLVELAERLGTPVVATENNKGMISEDHPLAMGVASIHGSPPAVYALQNADVILALGCNFGQFTTAGFGHKVIPEKAKIIQVDSDACSLGKIYPLAAGIEGSIDSVLEDLLLEMKERKIDRRPLSNNSWVRDTSKKKEEWEKSLEPLQKSDKMPIQRIRLMHDLRRALPADAVVAGGSGGTHGWFEYAFKAFVHTTYFGGWHAIGAEVGESLGARVALPDRTVVAICGDGGFMMSLQEIATAVAYKIPVLMVICHNNAFGNMRHTQVKKYGSRFMGTDLPIPNLADVARDFGAYGERVEKPDQIIPAVNRGLSSGKFALLDVIIDNSPENLVPPGSIGAEGWQ